MNFRHLLSKQPINNLLRSRPRKPTSHFITSSCNASAIESQISSSSNTDEVSSVSHPSVARRHFHSSPEVKFQSLAVDLDHVYHAGDDSEDADDFMNEFLSRFVYIMRGKLSGAYPECDKPTIDGMLLVIVEKVVAEMEKGTLGSMLNQALSDTKISRDFSDDLWKTVWEVSNTVCEDMEKERKKEQMKKFLQSEEVKTMAKFASEAGVRGDMLRELKFKWAREKMEESEFYENMKKNREEALASELEGEESQNSGSKVGEREKTVGLPKRKGKIKYKIYGLDLSAPKWKEVADKIHEAGEVMWPKEAKPITGKCKLVTEKIVSMEGEEDPSSLLAEWVELLQPTRADWESLLQILQQRNENLYYKVSEHVLDEPTFQVNIRDYSRLIDAYAKKCKVEDVERIRAKMEKRGIQADVLILTIVLHMYSKVGNVDCAKQAYESLQSLGFKPDLQAYSSMIRAYLSGGELALCSSLVREMEARRIEPTEEIYMAMLKAYAKRGLVKEAQSIQTAMQFAQIQPTPETYTLLVDAHGLAKDPDGARYNFDCILRLGHEPNDRSVASMLNAYKIKNQLDKGLTFLLDLEKQGFEPGINTYSVLLDWLCEMQLVDEAEQVLDKIARLGETPPLKIHVGLCEMYSKAKMEKKALQSLGVLETIKDQLEQEDFERVIRGLTTGGFTQDAKRMEELMKSLGFQISEEFLISLKGAKARATRFSAAGR